MRGTPAIQRRIRAISDRIAKDYNPERILLFGSHAWGEPGPDSDVDLLIVKETDARPTNRQAEVRRIIHDLRYKLPMDILVVTPSELSRRMSIRDQFCEKVMQEGVVLYGR